ncbi:MAG TPA: flagella basal body P-ring formation protein FlgA [Verrucomicrobiae bacterium]|nr:flagella basal body P-ring formation protein FlgA [Verrucomicrobiae bacterium]
MKFVRIFLLSIGPFAALLPAIPTFAAPPSAASSTAAAEVRANLPSVELRDSSVVRRDSVFLGDLLPAAAPETLRTAAREVAICTSPLPGHHRQISRFEIEAALQRFPTLPSPIRIPLHVDVTRWSRPLSRREILSAVSRAVERGNLRLPRPLVEDDLRLFFPVDVTEDRLQLKIIGIDADQRKSVTHLRVEVSSEPHQPPFWVDLDQLIEEPSAIANRPTLPGARPASSLIQAEFRPAIHPVWTYDASVPAGPRGLPARAAPSGAAFLPQNLQSEILVRVGRPVQVVAQIAGMRITTTATPLVAGRRGDTIRLRSLDNGRVFAGTVVGPQIVEVHLEE